MNVAARESDAIKDLVRLAEAQTIIEFGSWQGRSALAFLLEATKSHPNVTITCVDTWLGSSEHWSNTVGGEWSFGNLDVVDGEPRIIDTFRRTILEHGFQENVRILRCPTAFSEKWLKKNVPNSDLIYIDADHSTDAVYRDVCIASRLATQGVVCGDDWPWISVRRGILKYALRFGAKIFVDPLRTTWAISQPKNPELGLALEKCGWSPVSGLAVLSRLIVDSFSSGFHRLKVQIVRLTRRG